MTEQIVSDFLNKNDYPYFTPKAVFFDMDGVLFDSMKAHATAWVQAMDEVSIPFTHVQAYLQEGATGHATIDGAYLKHKGREATEDEKQIIYQLKTRFFEAFGSPEKMPFAHDLLTTVAEQGLQIFVVTGSGQPTLIDSLQYNFPGIFRKEKTVTAFDVIQGKPFPEPYLKALAKSGVQAWETLVVENAPLGVQSAKAAGLFTIAINTGPLDSKVLHDSGADLVLDGGMQELFEKWHRIVTPWLEKK